MRPLRLLTAALAAGLIAGAAQAATTLRITLQLPLTSILGQNLLVFKEQVEAASNGEIRIEIYPASQLYKDSEVPQAVSSGAIEMGVASLTLFAGTVPAVDVFYVPFLFDSPELVKAALEPGSPIRRPIEEEILKTGARILWWQPYGSTILLAKKEPVRTPEDIRGKKVRVFGRTLGRWVEIVGGVPVLISASEQFLAYQRGVVDIGMTGMVTVRPRKLDQVMQAITKVPIADIEFVVVINEGVWQSLTDDQRRILAEAAAVAEVDAKERIVVDERENEEYAISNGMVVYTPTAEEMELWRRASEPMFAWFAENAGELGAQLVEEAKALRAKIRGE